MPRFLFSVLFLVAGFSMAMAQSKGQPAMPRNPDQSGQSTAKSAGTTQPIEASVPQPSKPRDFPEDPVLLIRGDDYFVYRFVGAAPPAESGYRVLWPGVAISYVSRTTGTMKFLVNTGTFAIETVRRHYVASRLIGIAYDKERLYVLVWTTGQYQQPPPISDRGQVRFHVFWLADGSRVMDIPLRAGSTLGAGIEPKDLPTGVPEADTGSGPLEMRPNGIACFGVRFTFRDKSCKPEPDRDGGKQSAPEDDSGAP